VADMIISDVFVSLFFLCFPAEIFPMGKIANSHH